MNAPVCGQVGLAEALALVVPLTSTTLRVFPLVPVIQAAANPYTVPGELRPEFH